MTFVLLIFALVVLVIIFALTDTRRTGGDLTDKRSASLSLALRNSPNSPIHRYLTNGKAVT